MLLVDRENKGLKIFHKLLSRGRNGLKKRKERENQVMSTDSLAQLGDQRA